MKARFCSQCGEATEVRSEDGRDREVCPSCEIVFYRNPLPVVAAVVLDRDRRVLLVKRGQEPHAGMWCLPIGFAELGETIHEAALRELREEAGIEGRVTALLDADSFESGYYGDLLIVSFEVEKTGGVETPGDDAVEVGYFPLDALPPLAFHSNDLAVAACVARHEEEWRIQDSYRHLQEHSGELLSAPLVRMIETGAAAIAASWAEKVFAHRTTECMRRSGREHLEREAGLVLSRLHLWLRVDGDPPGAERGVHAGAAELRGFFHEWGEEWARAGCSVHEVLSSLSLLKRCVYDHARAERAWERAADAYRVVEFVSVMGSFFDRAAYHAALGFEGVSTDAVE